jgi:glycosyltransferase 2 family protein
MKNILKYLISLGVAGGLLWYVFKDIDLDAMLTAIKQADYRWVALYGVLTLVAHWSRAMRWGLLLEPVVGYRASGGNLTLAVLTGYFANLLIPRMGEVTRCGTLNQTDNVPVNVSFGTVVAERIFDVIVLVLLIGLTFVLEFGRLSAFLTEFLDSKLNVSKLQDNTGLLIGIGVVLVGGAVAAWWLFNRYKDRLMQNPLLRKVIEFGMGLLDGLLSVRKLRSPGLFVLHTLLIWTMYYATMYILFFAMPQTSQLGPLAGLTILTMGTIGMAAPTQGGLGAFNILVGSALALYGLTPQDGQTLATLMLLSQWLFVILFGAVSFLIVLTKKRRVSAEPVEMVP